MLLRDLLALLEDIAPTRYAEAWDNVGLLAGDPDQDVSRVLLTIDYTAAVAAEARRERSDFVIAYHPPIFQPIKRLTAGDVLYDAIRSGVAPAAPTTCSPISWAWKIASRCA